MKTPGAEVGLLPFGARLAAARATALRQGTLSRREYEQLLIDGDFDDDAFEEFRAELVGAGVRLPEDEVEVDEAPPDRRALAAEPELNLLEQYLGEIGRLPRLRPEELPALAALARGGDPGARKRMILANLRLVVFVARRYRERGLAFLDLIEEGNFGLMRAVDRFDPARGASFSTYASLWIRQSILRGLAEQSRAVRIPVQMFRHMNRFVSARRSLVHRFSREPSLEELALELSITPVRAERLQALVAGMRSADGEDGVDAFEALSAEEYGHAPASVERLVELQLEHEKLDRLLRALPSREEQLIRIRYGFYDGVARTLQETGEHFGITRERVRQIEAGALEKLRRTIELADGDRPAGETVH